MSAGEGQETHCGACYDADAGKHTQNPYFKLQIGNFYILKSVILILQKIKHCFTNEKI